MSYLPAECPLKADEVSESSLQSSNDTLCAVIGTLTDLVTDSTRTIK